MFEEDVRVNFKMSVVEAASQVNICQGNTI